MPSESELLQRYALIIKEPYISRYPHLVGRLDHFWERQMEWALSHRLEKNHTNNYAGAGMRMIKDCFGRIKAYNRIQMFQFITVTMEKYFINRLLDMAHSRYRPGIALRYKALDSIQKTFTNNIKQLRDLPYCRKQTRSWNIGFSGRYGHWRMFMLTRYHWGSL